MVPYDPDPARRFQALLQACVAEDATDLHLAAGAAARLRVQGRLEPRDEFGGFSEAEIEAAARSLLTERQWQKLQDDLALDMALTGPDGTRFRVNAYYERSGLALAIRRLEDVFRELDEWGLPASLGSLTELVDGLVLVTGPTGSGKTTTLATLLHMINRQRPCHILTIEDPIEYLHRNLQAIVHQREIHTSVPDFASAVRSALRQDPDVLLVGEMRDLDTMRTAITAAETGHLVFSTLHTGDAVGSIERMIGVFPADEQRSIRQQLSLVLREVVTQRLLPRAEGHGMVPAVEVLKVNTAVSNLIRTGRSEQIHSVMEASTGDGMCTYEQALARLVGDGLIEEDVARRAARSVGNLEAWLGRMPARGAAS
jgi:twitching motility protein PilT